MARLDGCAAPYRRHPLQQLGSSTTRRSASRGACQAGPGFEPTVCNNKVVGARLLRRRILTAHTSSTRTSFARRATRRARHARRDHDRRQRGGRVPVRHARREAFGRHRAARARRGLQSVLDRARTKTRATCATSDLARAVDDAVADGVDIINYSLGSTRDRHHRARRPRAVERVRRRRARRSSRPATTARTRHDRSPSSAPWVMTVGGVEPDRHGVRATRSAITAPTEPRRRHRDARGELHPGAHERSRRSRRR